VTSSIVHGPDLSFRLLHVHFFLLDIPEDMATAGPAHRVQSAAEVYGYPQGHIGHMTAEEQDALNGFKALLIEKGLYKPREHADEYGTHDDATLLYI
jgi:hypothetical protein